MGKITIKVPSNKKFPPKYIEKLNIEQLSDKTKEWLYSNRLKQKLATSNLTENVNVNEYWKNMKRNIT